MGSFARKVGKVLHVVDDPVSSTLRKQGGTLGSVGSFMNPGGAVNAKIAAGAPINARTLADPNGWVAPDIRPETIDAAPSPAGIEGDAYQARDRIRRMARKAQGQPSTIRTGATGAPYTGAPSKLLGG